MRSRYNTTLISAALITALVTAVPAQARDKSHDKDRAAAGVMGLAVGAIIGSILSEPSPPKRIYIDPPYQPRAYPAYRRTYSYDIRPAYPYQPPAPVIIPSYSYQPAQRYPVRPQYGPQTIEPWTQIWYQACSNRFRSFDMQSGTYLGSDGQRHFCNFN